MARPLRVEFPGALYHVTSRGNAQAAIFVDDEDRRTLLELLARELERSQWFCHAYCLMQNHFHLLVETVQPTLSAGMRQVNGVYAQAYNRRHRRVGHLFQARFHAVLVEKERHLLELARYVVLNPCRAGLCGEPGSWPWSSYRVTAGLEDARGPLTTEWLLGQFGGDRRTAQRRYREFVAGARGHDPWTGVRGQIYLGSEDFVRRHARACLPHKAAPRPQREPLRPRLAELLRDHGEHGLLVARQAGYSLGEIGASLGVHRTTVARRIHAINKGQNATT